MDALLPYKRLYSLINAHQRVSGPAVILLVVQMGLTIQFLLKLAMVGPVVQDRNSDTTRICILIQVSMYSHLINFLSFIKIAVARVELKVLLLPRGHPLGLHLFFMVCLPFRPVLLLSAQMVSFARHSMDFSW